MPVEAEKGSDLRLSIKLFRKCIGDYKKFCKDVEPGNMAAQECLEDHSDDPAFSAECKEELDNLIAKVSQRALGRTDAPVYPNCPCSVHATAHPRLWMCACVSDALVGQPRRPPAHTVCALVRRFLPGLALIRF